MDLKGRNFLTLKDFTPEEIQSIAGLVKSVTEIGADDKKEEK